ncbi:MAG: sulfite exporter TauE/SafE family protein [Oscillospiraceae bacterium]|nr:sulfite exporter TauE/SafE family protein [Oscillospiraceae bacterium]
MELIIISVVGLLSGIMASMGLGGGMVLILYLTAIKNMEQLSAQGINILFFIPVGIVAIILHSKRRLIKWKCVFLPLISGVVSVCIFAFLATKVESGFLKNAFGVFIIIMGIISLFKKNKKS